MQLSKFYVHLHTLVPERKSDPQLLPSSHCRSASSELPGTEAIYPDWAVSPNQAGRPKLLLLVTMNELGEPKLHSLWEALLGNIYPL